MARTIVLTSVAAIVALACDRGREMPPVGDASVRDDDAGPITPGTDSGFADGGGSGSCDRGTPLSVPDETWTYVEIEGTECGRGTPAGIGVNPATGSSHLLIYFKGGGACFSESDCAASDLDGFTAAKLAMYTGGNRLFDRTVATNPFRDYSFVFVPYCTGDFHSGDRVASYGIHHVGYRNVARYLERIVPTFCEADQVVVTGTSAGGFGSTFNYAQIHEAFGSIPVDLIDDSGPYMRAPYMGEAVQSLTDANWGWRANVPAGCTACASGWDALYTYAATHYPADRISLVSSLRDPSIQGRFSVYGGLATLDDFQRGIDDLADSVIVPLSNARVFYLATSGHVWTDGRLDELIVGRTSLETFLTQQITDDAAWANVRP